MAVGSVSSSRGRGLLQDIILRTLVRLQRCTKPVEARSQREYDALFPKSRPSHKGSGKLGLTLSMPWSLAGTPEEQRA